MEPSVALASISKSHAAVRKLAETTPILRVLYQGITVDVEKPPGFVQSGISPEGKAWTRVYGYRQDGTKVDGFVGYGCLPGTSGIDGEELDVYLGANAGAKTAFLIEQGAPDPEHKLMLGFPDAGAAIDCYLAHVPARMLAGVTAIPIALVQSLLACDEVAKSTSSEGVALRMLKGAISYRRGCAVKKAANYAANVIYARSSETLPPTGSQSGEWRALDGLQSTATPIVGATQSVVAAPEGFAHPCIAAPLSGAYVGAFASGWLGWIEPSPRPSWNPRDPAWTGGVGQANVNSLGDWIAFVGIDGTGLLWEHRDGGDGGVRGEPILFCRAPERRADDLAFVGATIATADLPDLAAVADLLALKARRDDLAKSALPIPRSTASLLIEAGPPDGWSGTIAAMIGDRKDGVIALWNALSEKEQISVRVAFGSLMCVDTIERSLKIEHVDLAKSDEIAPAFQVEAQFITKSIDEELRYVLGYVLEPLDGRAGEADTQGDFYTAETIRDAMWNYMKFFRNVSLNHKAYLNGRVFVVECWQTKNDEVIDGSQIRAGTWMLGINIVDDEIWGMVKRGELRALSIGGTAEKVPFAA